MIIDKLVISNKILYDSQICNNCLSYNNFKYRICYHLSNIIYIFLKFRARYNNFFLKSFIYLKKNSYDKNKRYSFFSNICHMFTGILIGLISQVFIAIFLIF